MIDPSVFSEIELIRQERAAAHHRRWAAHRDAVLQLHPDLGAMELRRRAALAHSIVSPQAGEQETVQAVLKEMNEYCQKNNIVFEPETPFCSICDDTGRDKNGHSCKCALDIYAKEQAKVHQKKVDFKSQNFSTFEPNRRAKGDSKQELSPYTCATTAFKVAKNYCKSFGKPQRNLLFVGQTGTGKSFFAIAIAQELCSQGYWVEFESALEYCNIAETAHFSRDSTHLDTMEKFFACDLFVLDDLGMEFQTSFSASAIYDIVNRRIQAHKSTVITTNLNKDALSETYHPQTISRLLGEYAVIALKGNDLRISE